MGDIIFDLKRACELRESGELDKSRILFEQLVSTINKDDEIYPQLMGEYIIQIRLESKQSMEKALDAARQLERDFPSEIESTRAVAHVLVDLEQYEQAIPRLEVLSTKYSDNSLRQGEEVAHLAYTYLRTGRIEEARELVAEALTKIRSNSANEEYVEVRESYALKVQALVELAGGKRDMARNVANEALAVAKKGKAVFRIKEAEELLKVIE